MMAGRRVKSRYYTVAVEGKLLKRKGQGRGRGRVTVYSVAAEVCRG